MTLVRSDAQNPISSVFGRVNASVPANQRKEKPEDVEELVHISRDETVSERSSTVFVLLSSVHAHAPSASPSLSSGHFHLSQRHHGKLLLLPH